MAFGCWLPVLAVQQGGEAVSRVFLKAAHYCSSQQFGGVGHVRGHVQVLGGQLQRGQCSRGGGTGVRRKGGRVVGQLARSLFHQVDSRGAGGDLLAAAAAGNVRRSSSKRRYCPADYAAVPAWHAVKQPHRIKVAQAMPGGALGATSAGPKFQWLRMMRVCVAVLGR